MICRQSSCRQFYCFIRPKLCYNCVLNWLSVQNWLLVLKIYSTRNANYRFSALAVNLIHFSFANQVTRINLLPTYTNCLRLVWHGFMRVISVGYRSSCYTHQPLTFLFPGHPCARVNSDNKIWLKLVAIFRNIISIFATCIKAFKTPLTSLIAKLCLDDPDLWHWNLYEHHQSSLFYIVLSSTTSSP